MYDHVTDLLSTEGLELHRYTNDQGEFCIDATLTNHNGTPTETIRFKKGDDVEIQQANGEFLIGKIVGPPVFNKASPSEHVDHFKALAEDANRTIIVDVTHVTVAGNKLPQLTPQQIMVDPAETGLFHEKLEAFIRLQDELELSDIEIEEDIFPEPEDTDPIPV
tara:strand:+ start:52 stop:543 length:492 start_codon:yes stop_codon:yes gene_type:complete